MKLTRLMRRLRLEVDQTLRTRSFVSRAVRGLLRPEEALDLIAQLAFLVFCVGGQHSARLIELAGDDALRLGPGSPSTPPPPCSSVHLMGELNHGIQAIGQRGAFQIMVAVVGTSWVTSASEASTNTPSGPSEFLGELGRSSTRCMRLLDQGAPRGDCEVQSLLAFAELGRGVLCGLANYLDSTWPPPIHTQRFNQSRPQLINPTQPKTK